MDRRYETTGVTEKVAGMFQWVIEVKTVPHWYGLSRKCMRKLFEIIMQTFTVHNVKEVRWDKDGIFVTLLTDKKGLNITNTRIRLDTAEGETPCCVTKDIVKP